MTVQSQSLFFTLFGDYVMDRGNTIRAASLVRLMSEFGLTESAVRAGLSRMTQKGLIVAMRNAGQSHYTLSAAGLRRLREGTRRVYRRTPHRWDGLWRLVVYAVPETHRTSRDQMRRELVWHGFGLLAQSTWISPNPLEAVVQELVAEYIKEQGTVDVFRCTHLGDPGELVARCWDLARVAGAYREFVQAWEPLRQTASALSDNEAFVRRIRLVHEYRKFLNIDPQLPQDLLPDPWIGDQAAELFRALHHDLTPAADRFFEANFEP